MRTVEDITHKHTVHLCVYTQCIVCVATTIALVHMADRSSGRTLAHGGQEHPSGQGHQLTNMLMLTYAHAHAV